MSERYFFASISNRSKLAVRSKRCNTSSSTRSLRMLSSVVRASGSTAQVLCIQSHRAVRARSSRDGFRFFLAASRFPCVRTNCSAFRCFRDLRATTVSSTTTDTRWYALVSVGRKRRREKSCDLCAMGVRVLGKSYPRHDPPQMYSCRQTSSMQTATSYRSGLQGGFVEVSAIGLNSGFQSSLRNAAFEWLRAGSYP